MELFNHILSREWLHLWVATLVLGPLSVIGWLLLKKYTKVDDYQDLITPALFVWALTILREAFDVSSGGWVGKSYIDNATWFVGLFMSCWGMWWLYRRWGWLRKLLERFDEKDEWPMIPVPVIEVVHEALEPLREKSAEKENQ